MIVTLFLKYSNFKLTFNIMNTIRYRFFYLKNPVIVFFRLPIRVSLTNCKAELLFIAVVVILSKRKYRTHIN